MDIYLPIAGQSVNALLIIALGFLVGVLSGMFGVGGGFLTTPLLMFYGISPPIAVASAASQISGASVSGVMVHLRRGGVDFKMGAVVIAGGLSRRIAGRLRSPLFAGRFIAKGRYRERMERVRVQLATYPEPGLLGAAVAFEHASAP